MFRWESWRRENCLEGDEVKDERGRKKKYVDGNGGARTGLRRQWREGMRRFYGWSGVSDDMTERRREKDKSS